MPKEIPFDRACLIGCGVMTGVGAALNVARIATATRVMVIGCGAVGLSAVQGARLAGAAEIIAVDLDDEKLTLAARMGATACVNARPEDDGRAVREARPRVAASMSYRGGRQRRGVPARASRRCGPAAR